MIPVAKHTPDEPGKRGRPRRSQPAEATGFRATESLRRELDLARAFTQHKSNQALIETAVVTYLRSLRDTNLNYRTAAEALDRELRAGADNVSSISAARRQSTTD